MNQRSDALHVNLVTEAIDVYIHHVGCWIDAHTPDVIEDQRAGNDPSGVAAEVFEQRKFLGRELQQATSAPDFAAHQIDYKVGNAEPGRLWLGRVTAQQISQSCYNLGERKRFGEIVISALLQTAHPIIDRPAGREN
jgi:hypothetical protein